MSKREIIIISASKFPGYSGDSANYIEIMNQLVVREYNVILVCPRVQNQSTFFQPDNISIIRIPFSPPRVQSLDQSNKSKLYFKLFVFLIIETIIVIMTILRFRHSPIFMRHSLLTIHLSLLFKISRRRVVADGEFVSDSC